MRPNRFVLRSLCVVAALCAIGAASAQDASQTDPALPEIAQAAPAGPLAVEDPASSEMGSAVALESLADMRGGAEVVDNDILVNGRIEDAVADDVLTGNNSVASGSFANASGISTVIQNTGANVLIQNAMIVNVKFADTGP